MVAADGDSAARLANVLAGDYVHVVAIAELDDNVAEAVQQLDPDVLVLAGGASMAMARAVAEAVAATASRVTVMIVDDAGALPTRVCSGRRSARTAPQLPWSRHPFRSSISSPAPDGHLGVAPGNPGEHRPFLSQ